MRFTIGFMLNITTIGGSKKVKKVALVVSGVYRVPKRCFVDKADLNDGSCKVVVSEVVSKI